MRHVKLSFLLLALTIFSCTEDNKTAFVFKSDCRPLIDGIAESCWDAFKSHAIDGSLVGDINREGEQDLSASFKVLQHNDDLIFLVTVMDDINGEFETSSLGQYWEYDNIEFFFTNTFKKQESDFEEKDSIFYINYNRLTNSLPVIKMADTQRKFIDFAQSSIDGGYMLEILFKEELKIFDLKSTSIPFNIEVTDNDNDDLEEGLIKGRESGIGWGYKSVRNSWKQTLNYGDLLTSE